MRSGERVVDAGLSSRDPGLDLRDGCCLEVVLMGGIEDEGQELFA